MNISEMIGSTERLLQEKNVTEEFVSKRLNSLFIQLSEELSPSPEVGIAHLFIEKWKKKLEENEEKHNASHKVVIDGIEDLTAMLLKLNKSIKNKQDTTFLTEAIMKKSGAFKIPAGYTDYSWVLNDGEIATNLFIFQKEALTEIGTHIHKFRYLNFLLKFFRAVIFALTAVAAYYIGGFVEDELKLNKLVIALIATLICFYTTDAWLNRLKTKIFWRISGQLFQHIKDTYIQYIGLKLQFDELIKKWPEILSGE